MDIFCIEILGEGSRRKTLVHTGWSGKEFFFFYNSKTDSHLRVYRSVDEYRAERVDLHARSSWFLLGNILPEDKIDAEILAIIKR